MGVFGLLHLIVATLAAWAIYSFVLSRPNSRKRSGQHGGDPSGASFAAQMLATVLGSIAFAWIIAPLNTISPDDLSTQLIFRFGGIISCAIPVVIIYSMLRFIFRRQV